jgi:hypothetical protein
VATTTVGQASDLGTQSWAVNNHVTRYVFRFETYYGFVTMNDNKFISLIQHELSHNCGAQHDVNNNNVMRSEICECFN